MAADAAALAGLDLAPLPQAVQAAMDTFLPPNWSHGNPVDIIGDAPVERYVRTLKTLLADPATGTLLFMHAPTAIVPSADIARALLPLATAEPRRLVSCWLGGPGVAEARQVFHAAGVPSYDTPEQAVRACALLATYRRNQDQLMQAPPARTAQAGIDGARVRELVAAVLASGREMMTEPEAKALLQAAGVPVVATEVVDASPEEAVAAAAAIGFPVVLKILSPQISHKSDVGGVALQLDTADDVRRAALAMLARVARLRPDAQVQGFTVQAMVQRPQALELIVGSHVDPLFGPVILFGQGGTAVEVVADRAVALPPLNEPLAQALIDRTRVARLLAGWRDVPPADRGRPGAGADGVVAAAGRRTAHRRDRHQPAAGRRARRAGAGCARAGVGLGAGRRGALRDPPLPQPTRSRPGMAGPAARAAADPARGRSAAPGLPGPAGPDRHPHARVLQPAQHRTQRTGAADADRLRTRTGLHRHPQPARRAKKTLAVVRAVIDPDNVDAEFGIVVRSDLKGGGLGVVLMKKLIRHLREHGTQRLVATVLAENTRMLELARDLGFVAAPLAPGDDTVSIALPLA
jgi:acetyltransferase